MTYEDYPCDYVNLSEMAKNQVSRSIKFMHSYVNKEGWHYENASHNDYPGSWHGFIADKAWVIKDPVSECQVPEGGDFFSLWFYVNHFEDAGNWVTGDDLSYPSTAASVAELGLLGIIVHLEEPLMPMPIETNHYNNIGKLALSTISKTINAESLHDLFHNIRKYVDYWNQELPGGGCT